MTYTVEYYQKVQKVHKRANVSNVSEELDEQELTSLFSNEIAKLEKCPKSHIRIEKWY